jgi:hypothetical protein
MKQHLRSMYTTLTYRNDYTDPNPADGLQVTDQRGTRTVHHPDLPAYLHARRRRILREGLDPIDLALMDPDTASLLLDTAACQYCVCHPMTCAADDTGQHCHDRSCGPCLHGCPTDECNPATGQTHHRLTRQVAAGIRLPSRQRAQA